MPGSRGQHIQTIINNNNRIKILSQIEDNVNNENII
jgi:hypothetical protein